MLKGEEGGLKKIDMNQKTLHKTNAIGSLACETS